MDPFLLIMIAILALFMLMTFRRGKKMRDAQSAAVSGAVPGAEVVTAGGIVGTVVARDEERQRVTLEFSGGDRVDFQLPAVQHVLTPATSPEEPSEEPSEDPSEETSEHEDR
ncbi:MULTISPECIES: preprotein translocase subunit YajC [Nesterenkonia]|uniref:Preprotein translocase subunit YajC n=1 Tax=Nesterenkonia xinjiangensis TaxID=225327 RepID=A0A7Z0GP53_9MICC|nr:MULTISPECIES: preprotein translocase subunit YajC [Nesterenkonia]MDZ5078424.1 preprotein translocase subunit YajC [Nesterenkonia sp. HG001]NYJ79590.1 preprotein translocase subunit YajC [Nesterenkonia xinjiangensis]